MSLQSFISNLFVTRERPLFLNDAATATDFVIGERIGSRKPFGLSASEMNRHMLIAGAGGSGASQQVLSMVLQQTERGGGWIYLDMCGDINGLQQIEARARDLGRADDLIVLDFGADRFRNAWSPLRLGEPEEVTAKLLSGLSTPDGQNEEFGIDMTWIGLTKIITALNEVKPFYRLNDLVQVLVSATALDDLLLVLPGDSKTSVALRTFLNHFDVPTETGLTFSHADYRQFFAGVAERLLDLRQGNLGLVVDSDEPSVNFYEAWASGKMVYINLPFIEKSGIQYHLARMLLTEFELMLHTQLRSGEHRALSLLVLNELTYDLVKSISPRLYEQARACNISLLLKQSILPILASEEEADAIIIGNTWTKLLFRQSTHSSSESASAFLSWIGIEVPAGSVRSLGMGEMVAITGGMAAHLRISPIH